MKKDMKLHKFIATTIHEYLNENNYLSNRVYKNIETINTNNIDELLEDAVNWAVSLIKTKLNITPDFKIKWGDDSSTFDNSIKIRFKNPYHFKNREEFYDTVLHEICHVIDNTFGNASSRFGLEVTRQISDSIEWKKIPLNTAPTSYAKYNKVEDFVISLQYALYGRLYELTNDRVKFLKQKFPKLK